MHDNKSHKSCFYALYIYQNNISCIHSIHTQSILWLNFNNLILQDASTIK